jgi:threonine/homoserine/homoserine lactone efflux protein
LPVQPILGIQALLARELAPQVSEQLKAPSSPKSYLGDYRQGVVNDLLNPKIGVFYTMLLPQFIAPGQAIFLTSVLLATLFAPIVAVWLGSYVLVLDWASAFFQRSSVRRTLERITGLVLVGLGFRLALERH